MKISIFFVIIWLVYETSLLFTLHFCFCFKKLLKYIQFAKYLLFVSYAHDIIVSFSYLVTPPFRSTNSLLFEIREAKKLSKSKKKVSLDRIKFYWQISVNFIGKNYRRSDFLIKCFIFFQTNQHRKLSCRNAFTQKNGVFWKKILKQYCRLCNLAKENSLVIL